VRALPSAAERVFEIRVHDAERKPLAGADVTMNIEGETLTETAGSDGIATFKLPLVCPDHVDVSWVAPNGDLFEQSIFLDCSDGELEFVAGARLKNLGYPSDSDIELAVAAFQIDYGLELERVGGDGSLPQSVLDQLRRIWDDRLCDATRPSGG